MSQINPAETTLVFSKIVERYAHFFERPEVRLRFLNKTLALHSESREKLNRFIARHPFLNKPVLYNQLLELWLYHLIFHELKKLLPDASKERLHLLTRHKVPYAARLFFGFYQLRHLFYSFAIVVVAVSLFGLYTVIVSATHRVNTYLTQRYQTADGSRSVNNAQKDAFTQTSAKYLPDYQPEKVWLVEQKDNYERYSNGGRILTNYETTNHLRGYTVFNRERVVSGDAIRREPIGIVYHTSESHLMAFTPDNNDSIETHSRGLLEYVQKNQSYHYVIDRFGQIYRIVRDEHAANHAGNSVWANGQDIYVGLNESFIGVSFETNSQAGSLHEQLTEAQILSGRLLTQILRSRYQIEDANCVTHGLVSVNPQNMLIAFHHDWARNFPFEAMGISDKYKVAPASVSEFGFTYDDETVNKLGGTLWAGVKTAEEEFKRRVEDARSTPEAMRRILRERYRNQMASQLHLRSSSNETAANNGGNASSVQDNPDTAKQE
ncbi:MAG TPA: peptidoglycan recognition family protein [Pyrinomonadaceae bacterium]|jgi:N-acetyl-anhydromuramyl-L-alanine amidase AmpD